jgi:hypothetical protein
LAVLLLLGACTGPVRSTGVYESKAAQGIFEGIQPPDHRADELRDRLDQLVGQATDTLTELRTLARRGRFAELVTAAAPLAEVAGKLHAFAEAHA